MKRFSLFFSLVIYSGIVHAQWTAGPVDINNTNTGNVGIKTTTPTHTLTIGSEGNGIVQYNTTDQTVNFERARLYWGSNIFTISAEYSGTGIGRSIQLSAGTSDFTVNTSNVGTPVGGVFNFNRNTTSKTLLGTTGTITGSSTANLVSLFNTVNQTGAGGYRGLWVSPYEQAIGTGNRLLIDAGTNSAENGTGTHISRFAVTSSGAVGIGTTSPIQLLDVQKASAAGDVAIRIANLSPGALDASTSSLIFGSNSNPRNAGRIVAGRDIAGSYNSASAADSYLALFTALDDTDLERMRVLSNGNVGIGTSSPSSLLDISSATGTANISPTTLNITSTSNASDWSTTAPWGRLDFYSKDASGIGNGTRARVGAIMEDINGGTVGLSFYTSSNAALNERMRITNAGNVGIGITNPNEKLAVNGTIHSKEVKVDLNGWSDYVFSKQYRLPSLSEVKKYIDEKGRLPEMPSEQMVVKEGLNLGQMNALLVKKIEELTLYLIEQKDHLVKLEAEVERLKTKVPSQDQ